MNRLFITIALGLLVSCAAPQKTTTTGAVKNDSVGVSTPKKPFIFSFYMSGSGNPKKAEDSWTMDTTGLMAVKTVTPDSPGHWTTINALAQLDPPDYDSLSTLIQVGHLWAIDSADIDQQCAGDELYNILIVPTRESKHLRATFQACAQDYNLLLEPQRTQFNRLIAWFERMRVKYRPVQP